MYEYEFSFTSNNFIFFTAIKPGHHPVKRRGVTSVTKCHKCNGTGLIFIGELNILLLYSG